MGEIAAFLQAVFALRARQGWFLFLVGIVMWSLIYADVLPAADLPIGWKAAFALLTVAGAVILVVCMGGAISERISASKQADRAAAKARLHQERDAFIVQRNVAALSGMDAATLLQILAGNRQRFNMQYDVVAPLLQKGIVYPIDMVADIYEVEAFIWEKRSALMASLPKRASAFGRIY